MSSKFLPFLALILSLGIFFAYINPTWTGPIATAKAAIASDNASLAAASQYNAQASQLATEEAAINPTDLTDLSNMLPDSVDNVGMILDINALAARSGLLLSNINVTQNSSSNSSSPSAANPSGSTADTVGSVQLSLSAVGSYEAFQQFLTGIESSQRLLNVQSINVAGSNTGVYTYQVTMNLYWLQ
jgi:Tfp pilus assembly protein PilO